MDESHIFRMLVMWTFRILSQSYLLSQNSQATCISVGVSSNFLIYFIFPVSLWFFLDLSHLFHLLIYTFYVSNASATDTNPLAKNGVKIDDFCREIMCSLIETTRVIFWLKICYGDLGKVSFPISHNRIRCWGCGELIGALPHFNWANANCNSARVKYWAG